MSGQETEVLVIGSGIAGCATALAAARKGAAVTMLTKASRPDGASTDWAQGGISTARGDPDSLKRDILTASDGTADPEAVDVLVEHADEAVREVLLETLGIEFDLTTGDGSATGKESFDYTREAAHSKSRILHIKASTGRHILRPFLANLEGLEAVEIRQDTAALELITHEGRVHGVLTDEEPTGRPIFAGATVLATGGIGSLYTRSTNPAHATGDGIAVAALAGADVADLEYVQFHPTAYADEKPFLLSEALRGEGALLYNGDGERFMPAVHPDAELAPRDVVARAVARERERTGEVVLDVSPLDFEGDFPGLAAKCVDSGLDVQDGRIPVAPCEHFCCGGVSVDDRGRTSLAGLYAVGECSRTGVHGANRLASTSLLEGLVWGLRAGEDAVGTDPEPVEPPVLRNSDPALPERFAEEKFTRLRRTMDEYLGLEREPEEIKRAGAVLRRLKGEVDAYTRTRSARDLYELRNACVTALLIARSARENTESVGCHYVTKTAPSPSMD